LIVTHHHAGSAQKDYKNIKPKAQPEASLTWLERRLTQYVQVHVDMPLNKLITKEKGRT
jgi:hypothetical protein